MTKLVPVIVIGLALGGCSTLPQDVFTGTPDCGYIGCATGGLQVYPNEVNGATEQPKRWYGWDWGTSSSAFFPGTPEYNAARSRECARARSYGLDCMGRSLYEN